MVNDDPNQYFFYTDFGDWDWLLREVATTSRVLTGYFAEFLLAQQPDVVHFQHTPSSATTSCG